MMRTIPAIVAILAFASALLLGACGSGETPPAGETAAGEAPATEAATEKKLYDATGTIESIEAGRITIAHEDIPGLMDAMTMPFSVDDPSMLRGLEPGMQVEFRLLVTASRYIIVEISPLPE